MKKRKEALATPQQTLVPSSILKTHKSFRLFLDKKSALLI
jgi:6-phosphogluconolactonase/glucosamine-6-phosphate isomerase/deaminase